jgi:hypothetical protein
MATSNIHKLCCRGRPKLFFRLNQYAAMMVRENSLQKVLLKTAEAKEHFDMHIRGGWHVVGLPL